MSDPKAAGTGQLDPMQTIFALDGIFAALDWIDEGWLDDKLHVDQLKAARTHLIGAGKLLCEQTTERF